MGRKRIFDSSTERVRAWREKHKEPEYIVVSKEGYEAKLSEAKKIWDRTGLMLLGRPFTPEQVINSWEAYKEYWLKNYNIDVEKIDAKHLDYQRKKKISIDLQYYHPEQIIDLGFGLSYIDVEECLYQLPIYLWNNCSNCNQKFMLLLKKCPNCGAIIKIEETKHEEECGERF